MGAEVITKEALLGDIESLFAKHLPPAVVEPAAEMAQDDPKPAPGWSADLLKFAQELPGKPKETTVIEMLPEGGYRLMDRGDIVRETIAADMRQGILGPIEAAVNPVFPAIPLGSIAVGGLVGLIAGEVIDGVVSPTTDEGGVNPANIGVKVVVAGGLWFVGRRAMSKQAVLFGITVLGIQVLADMLPLDRVVNWFVDLFNRNGTVDTSNRRIITGTPLNQLDSGPSGDQIEDIF